MDSIRQKSHGMSVEEIIKSIKGIIDDHNNTADKSASDDVLELTEIVENKENLEKFSEHETIDKIDDNLISETTTLDALNKLKQFEAFAKAKIQENKQPKIRTIEDLVVEMMKPQLKKWLDDNLPNIIQKLVEKEIRRLIPDEKE
jgi:uncharacterized protein